MNKIIITQIPKFIISKHIIKIYKNTTEDIDQLENNILSKFENTNCVILVGQVQSGKTSRIISIMKKALYYEKYQYDLIIYLSGLNNELNQQVYERLYNDFNNIYNVKNLNKIEEIKKLVIVSIKDKNRLEYLVDFVESHKSKIKKILIIDDESDYGAINTNKDKENVNVVYKNVYDELYKLCYPYGGVLKVTATPFVNILTEKDFLLSNKEPFLFSMPTNDNYTGVKFFNKLDNEFWFTSVDEDTTNELNIEDRKQDILKAYFIWVYKSYLLFYDKNIKNFNKSDFLINISNAKNDHDKIADMIGLYCGVNIKEEIIKSELRAILDKEIKSKISEEEYEKIYDFYFNIMCVNSKVSKFNGNQLIRVFNVNYNIIIGGFLLSRGKTFENLICELITIKNKNKFNYDILLQKCRWFGYRGNRSKYMAVVCNREIKKQLDNVEKIINLFHDNNLGYELNYRIILKTLKEKADLFINALYTTSRKIK